MKGIPVIMAVNGGEELFAIVSLKHYLHDDPPRGIKTALSHIINGKKLNEFTKHYSVSVEEDSLQIIVGKDGKGRCYITSTRVESLDKGATCKYFVDKIMNEAKEQNWNPSLGNIILVNNLFDNDTASKICNQPKTY